MTQKWNGKGFAPERKQGKMPRQNAVTTASNLEGKDSKPAIGISLEQLTTGRPSGPKVKVLSGAREVLQQPKGVVAAALPHGNGVAHIGVSYVQLLDGTGPFNVIGLKGGVAVLKRVGGSNEPIELPLHALKECRR